MTRGLIAFTEDDRPGRPPTEVSRFEDTEDFFTDGSAEWHAFACGFWWGVVGCSEGRVSVQVIERGKPVRELFRGSSGFPDMRDL